MSSRYSDRNVYRLVCASTVKNTAAKNQATTGWRSTDSTAGAVSWPPLSSRVSGRRSAATSSSANMPVTSHGNQPMPARSSTPPAATTVTMKPIEPQTRTRP